MFKDLVKETAKHKRVLILFDMDGTCVEYGTGEKQRILDNEPGFYYSKRPVKTVIREMLKFSKIKNVQVGILSNCYFKEQKIDKIAWLNKYIPQISLKNIHVLVYGEMQFSEKEKDFLKYNYIADNLSQPDLEIYLIEDQHEIIKATNKKCSKMAHHISEILQ